MHKRGSITNYIPYHCLLGRVEGHSYRHRQISKKNESDFVLNQ